MKVLLAAGMYRMGGTASVMESLAEQLQNHGFEMTIGAYRFKRKPPSSSHFDIQQLPVGHPAGLRMILRQFDVIHSHHPLANYLALLVDKPFLYHYHGAPNKGVDSVYWFSAALSCLLTSPMIDGVIACSQTGKNEIGRLFRSKQIRVIHNGVDLSRFRPGLSEMHRHGDPQFLFVGNLYRHKRVDELIEALKSLILSYPRAHLCVVGTGDSYPSLLRKAAQMGVSDHVTFAGSVLHESMPFYYAACDVYLSASTRESYPLPVLESWACGKPVVLSSIPAHQEMLVQCGAGRVYAAGDIVDLSKKAIQVYEQRREFVSLALKYARMHGWESAALDIAEIYSHLNP